MFAQAASFSPTTVFASSAAASEPGRVVRTRSASVIRILRPSSGQRQGGAEDASFSGHVLDIKGAAIGLHALAADREPQPEAAGVRAALPEGAKELIRHAGRKTAAFVLHFDADLAGGNGGAQQHVAIRARVLEGIG